MSILLAITGLIFGLVGGDTLGGLTLALAGYLLGEVINNRNKLDTLKNDLDDLRALHRSQHNNETAQQVTQVATPEATSTPIPKPAERSETKVKASKVSPAPSLERKSATDRVASSTPSSVWVSDSTSSSKEMIGNDSRPPNIIEESLSKTLNFFVTGNVVLKAGVLVLFVGVGFLLKLAADNGLFPIELRLGVTAVSAIGLLIFGWKLRLKNPTYAVTVQGAAIGILYMIVFASALIYELIPLLFAFAIMFALVGFGCMLAVLQNSISLAIFATIGGFLAPILTSSGSGSHVALFSYYAILNAGIFGIAWYKSWKLLNWIGFLFTFVIASIWGSQSYLPSNFSTTEPFLILFFLFYVFNSILYAHKQPPELRGLVDGSLVFGVPIAAFTLQTLIVLDFEYGLAFTSIGLGLFYISVAKILWSKQVEGMRLLTECFLALGVVFASLAIPFTLNGTWTAAAWAIEGAGMLWIGQRQNRFAPTCFGILLQVAGGIAFLTEAGIDQSKTALFNSAYLGTLLLAAAGLASSWITRGKQVFQQNPNIEVSLIFLIWGLGWWWLGGINEVLIGVIRSYQASALLLFFSLASLVISALAKRAQWREMEVSLLMYPVALLASAVGFLNSGLLPHENIGPLVWIVGFATLYRLLFIHQEAWPVDIQKLAHVEGYLLIVFISTWMLTSSLGFLELHKWTSMIWGIVPALAIFFVRRLRTRMSWPLLVFDVPYRAYGTNLLALYLFCWILIRCTFTADPSPLPYFPLLNPQDILLICLFAVLVDWVLHIRKVPLIEDKEVSFDEVLVAFFGLSFFWLNTVIGQIIHFYADVPFTLQALASAAVFQTSISIVWTVVALLGMSYAKRIGHRNIWIASAVLLGVTVVKLFVVDLGDVGTVARIVSFISVGGLMLVIGYFAPIPPSQTDAADGDTSNDTLLEDNN